MMRFIDPIFQFAASQTCNLDSGTLLGLPTWFKYLQGAQDKSGKCVAVIRGINDIWLIVAAIIDILIRVGAIVAIIFVVYGGFTYVTSQGEPDATKKARDTIVNALIGLVVAVMSAALITFVAGSIN